MKKKTYQKATMKVVGVETETPLLSGSAVGFSAERAAYTLQSPQTWGD